MIRFEGEISGWPVRITEAGDRFYLELDTEIVAVFSDQGSAMRYFLAEYDDDGEFSEGFTEVDLEEGS